MKKEHGTGPPHTERTGFPLPVRLLAAAALCAAVCAALWFFWGRGGGANTYGEETPYPYSWQTRRDGSVELSLKNDPESGCRWQAEDPGGETLTVEALSDGEGGNTTFLLTPRTQGLTMVTFVYKSPEDDAEWSKG